MRQPIHAMSGRKQMTPERIVGIGFVAVLHVIVIWAIVTGLAQKIVKAIPQGPMTLVPVVQHPEPPPKPVKIPEVKLPTEAHTSAIPPPQIIIHDDTVQPPPLAPQPPRQTDQHASLTPDAAAVSVSGTHTTPPYPALDRRLGNQGTVELKLTISLQGAVVAADIVKSSGFPSLDQAALSWVMGHWKYKPAIQGGVPVASTTVAAVVFSIRNAG